MDDITFDGSGCHKATVGIAVAEGGSASCQQFLRSTALSRPSGSIPACRRGSARRTGRPSERATRSAPSANQSRLRQSRRPYCQFTAVNGGADAPEQTSQRNLKFQSLASPMRQKPRLGLGITKLHRYPDEWSRLDGKFNRKYLHSHHNRSAYLTHRFVLWLCICLVASLTR